MVESESLQKLSVINSKSVVNSIAIRRNPISARSSVDRASGSGPGGRPFKSGRALIDPYRSQEFIAKAPIVICGEERLSKMGLPIDVRAVALIPLGYPVEIPESKARRLLSEIVSYMD